MDTTFAQPAHSEERPRAPTEARALLRQCKALACSRLSTIIAEALTKVEHDLFALASEAPGAHDQQVLLEAMAQLRTHRAEIARTFDRCFAELYEERVDPHRATAVSSEPLSLDDLTLIDEADMEEELAVNELARRTKNHIDPDQLLGIQARFGHLLARDRLDDEGNPLSPDAVFKALKKACATIPGDFVVKRSLLNAVQPYIASGIGKVYADVNENLIAHRVLPRIRHQVQRAADRPVGMNQPAGLSQSLGAPPGMQTSQLMHLSQLQPGMSFTQPVHPMALSMPLDLSALLASVMSGPPSARQQAARMFADPASYRLEQVMDTPATPALLASLSQLQNSAGSALGADVLATLDQQVRAQSHPLDQLTIELVTMVFDYILDDRDVPDTIKAEISRLQIVAVKAALLDRTFFARRQHPMRQLLDRIAEAAQDPDIDTHADSTFVAGLRDIANDAVLHFVDDLSIFVQAREKLEALIAASTQAQRQTVEAVAVDLSREERRALADVEARTAVRSRLTRQTPGFVREFLYNWWSRVLVEAALNSEDAAAAQQPALAAMDTLIWSVSPLQSTDIQRLAALLPQLMRDLLQGMETIAMPEEPRQQFFNQLMQTHTTAVNALKSGRMEMLEEQAEAESEGPLPPETEDTDAAMADAQMEMDEAAESEASDAAGDFYSVDVLLHTVSTLERGTILEFIENDEPVRRKLSWISPQGTVLLFTSSTHGACKFSPETLAAALQKGQAQIVETSAALVDRAFDALVAEDAAA